ncbi:MAG TPA: hypothetical protein VFI42_09110 [Thermomicrobiaceae bacterium]|nr:hypothetical protein [Thermomicrobiaceae bacterium]
MSEYKRVHRETEVETPDAEATQPLQYQEQRVEERRVADGADPEYRRREVETVRSARPRRTVENEYVERHDPYLERQILYSKISNVVWTIIGLIEALIALRVILKLIGANAGNGFVSFIYSLSGVFVAPFLGIVSDPTSGNSILEINSLIAMLVYLILGWGILKLIVLAFNVTEPPTAP